MPFLFMIMRNLVLFKIDCSFTPEGIPLLCDIIKKNADKLSPMSQELMTAVRVLKMLCTEPKLIELEKNELVNFFDKTCFPLIL